MRKLLAVLCLLLALVCVFSACGEEHTHDFGEWSVITAATCTTKGTKKRTCACGESETQEIPITHIYGVDNRCTLCHSLWQYTEGLEYILNNDRKSYTVKKGTALNNTTDIVIPWYHEKKPVTNIGNDAFRNCYSLTSITIPASVTSIGYDAFEECNSLTSATFDTNSQLTSIDSSAFYNCNSLTSITIPASVTSIGYDAFYGCSSLTSITVDSSNTVYHSSGDCLIETASQMLLTGCKNSIIPTDGSVTSIGNKAFHSCKSLTSITIPASVTSIGNEAFYSCDNLTSVTFENNGQLTSICNEAFSHCNSLTSITIPSSVTSIGNRVFYGCKQLIQVENSVSYVDKWVIDCATNVTSVSLRTNTVGISNSAFYNCRSLTSITLPANVTSINELAFSGCRSLTSITVDSDNTVYHSAGNCLIETASKTLITGCKNSVIPTDGSVTSIGNYAFDGCESLTSITIPASVTSIGYNAFHNCDSLTSATFAQTSGWWYASSYTATSGASISSSYLANGSAAATYLKSNYSGYYWKRTVG